MSKAVIFEQFGLDALKVVDREAPQPRHGEVRVRLEAVSLNYRDLMMVRGHYNPKLPLPLIPCSDGAGFVEAVGPGVQDIAVGDRVCSTMIPDWEAGRPAAKVLNTTLGGPVDGMLAEHRTLPAQALLKLPEGMDPLSAACLPVAGLTAWSALVDEAQVKPGQRVLLLGTGGVSIMALDIAKAMGCEVIITSGSDEKLARAKALGADHGINYKTQSKWGKAVRDIAPEGVDVVLEVGGDGTFDQSVKATTMGGTVAMIGVLAHSGAPVNMINVLMHRIRVQGILVGSRASFRDYLRFMDGRRPEGVYDQVFQGLDAAPEAFQLMASGGHFGKILIDLR